MFIRGYGPKGKKHWLYELFYNELFPHITISMDSTNNTEPSKTIHALTDYSKNVKIENIYRIQNYQVSHLFGRTKNPLLFTAGWNIAYVPKYLDPFTGHETKGKYPTDFRPKFYKKNVDMFKVEIDEYNKLLEEKILLKIDDALKLVEANKKTVNELKPGDFKRFKKSVEDELSPIKMNFK